MQKNRYEVFYKDRERDPKSVTVEAEFMDSREGMLFFFNMMGSLPNGQPLTFAVDFFNWDSVERAMCIKVPNAPQITKPTTLVVPGQNRGLN